MWVIAKLFDWIILRPAAGLSRNRVSRQVAAFQSQTPLNLGIVTVCFAIAIFMALAFTDNGRWTGTLGFTGGTWLIICVWHTVVCRYPAKGSGIMLSIPFLKKHVSLHFLRPNSITKTRHAWRALPQAVHEALELGFSEIVAESPLLLNGKIADAFASRMASALDKADRDGKWQVKDWGEQEWNLTTSKLFQLSYGDTLTPEYLQRCSSGIILWFWPTPKLLVRKICFVKTC